MKLLFTGTLSSWLLIPLFLGLSAITVYLYRRHKLPRPWSIWLPAVRILVIALLILSLFQPVLARFKTVTVRGHIPIIVDTSGSMSLADTYPTNRQVKITWSMEMFPKQLRNYYFEENEAAWKKSTQQADTIRQNTERMIARLKAQKPWTREFSGELDVLAADMADLRHAVDRFANGMEQSVKSSPYLAGQKTPGKAPTAAKTPPVAPSNTFSSSMAAFTPVLTGLRDALDKLIQDLATIRSDKVKNPQGLAALLAKYNVPHASFARIAARLPELQKLADERLAQAAIPEVDNALKQLADMKRSDLARQILTGKPFNLLEKLESRGEVAVYSFKDVPETLSRKDYTNLVGTLPSTKIGSAVCNVLQQYEKQPVAGIILISDGNNNAGKAINNASEGLRERDIPLYALGIGALKPPPDIAIARVARPRTSFVEDRLNISVVLTRHGFTDRPIRLKAVCGEEVVNEKVVEPGTETRLVVDMSFVEKKGGTRRYHIEAEQLEKEAFTHNNKKSFAVNILEDRIRTLLVDEFPRWESRYAAMMLSRDKRVDLRTVFVASAKDGRLPIKKEAYPENRNQLFSYHIIVLGDVNPRHFSTSQMEDLRAFVVDRGGTLIALAGEHHMPNHYVSTPLEELLPLTEFGKVPLNQNGPEEALSNYRLRIAEFGKYEDVVQIGGTPESSQDLWQGLPTMNWIKKNVAASPAADLLVNGQDNRDTPKTSGNAADRNTGIPVMAKSYIGLGKTLYLGSDSFWRWRYRARWKYHHRFWGQILLWATMGRTSGADKFVKLMTDRLAYAPEEVINVSARILDDQTTPINEADATLEVLDDTDKLVKTVPLVPLTDSGGEYRGQIRGLPRGSYRVIPRVRELKDKEVKASLTFEVQDLPTSEYIDLALNESHLKRVASQYMPFDQAIDLAKDVRRIEFTEEQRDDSEMWDTWPFMILIALLLGFEWQMRKKLKLV